MGTPFISFLPPTRLDGYVRSAAHSSQPSAGSFPPVFLDAMSVREAVFVREQGVPLECEHDADDARSCHWVAYASVHDAAPQPQTRSAPIGTLRIVPFPHPPHPPSGARYVGDVLQEDPSPSSSASGEYEQGGKKKKGDDSSGAKPLTSADEERQASALPFGLDRPTTYHDGKEPYVKLGRVAVVSEFRGHRIAAQLWRAAREWLEENPAFFNPSVTELGMDQLKAGAVSDIPRWNGLVCCHAQEQVAAIYEKWGFKVDEGMGKWFEEGIPHVGMFQRLQIKGAGPEV
ncbi:hypothetical protein AAE478_005467 [Parahypoxylon ruwenzoriense]